MPSSIFMRACFCACLFTLIAWTPSASSEEKSPQHASVRQLAVIVNEALESNPEIKAAQAAVDSAKARLTGSALPLNNPELELEYEHSDINKYIFGISQTIDWHDKRHAFEEVARAELTAARARVDALRLTKAAELLDAIGRIAAHHEITTLAKSRSEILDRFAKLAKQHQAAGDISQTPLDLARLSLAEAVMQHAEYGAELIQARSDYATLSGQSFRSRVKFPELLPTTLPDAQHDEALVRKHPQVQAAQQLALASRRQAEAVGQERKVDPTFALAAGREDEESLISLSFSIPLQVRNDFRSNVDAAQSRALQAEQEAHQTYRNLQSRLSSARERYELVSNAWAIWASQGRISLQQRSEILEAMWRAGEISSNDYLFQVQQTLDARIAGVELKGNLWKAWVEWLSASGSLDAWLNNPSKEH